MVQQWDLGAPWRRFWKVWGTLRCLLGTFGVSSGLSGTFFGQLLPLKRLSDALGTSGVILAWIWQGLWVPFELQQELQEPPRYLATPRRMLQLKRNQNKTL